MSTSIAGGRDVEGGTIFQDRRMWRRPIRNVKIGDMNEGKEENLARTYATNVQEEITHADGERVAFDALPVFIGTKCPRSLLLKHRPSHPGEKDMEVNLEPSKHFAFDKVEVDELRGFDFKTRNDKGQLVQCVRASEVGEDLVTDEDRQQVWDNFGQLAEALMLAKVANGDSITSANRMVNVINLLHSPDARMSVARSYNERVKSIKEMSTALEKYAKQATGDELDWLNFKYGADAPDPVPTEGFQVNGSTDLVKKIAKVPTYAELYLGNIDAKNITQVREAYSAAREQFMTDNPDATQPKQPYEVTTAEQAFKPAFMKRAIHSLAGQNVFATAILQCADASEAECSNPGNRNMCSVFNIAGNKFCVPRGNFMPEDFVNKTAGNEDFGVVRDPGAPPIEAFTRIAKPRRLNDSRDKLSNAQQRTYDYWVQRRTALERQVKRADAASLDQMRGRGSGSAAIDGGGAADSVLGSTFGGGAVDFEGGDDLESVFSFSGGGAASNSIAAGGGEADSVFGDLYGGGKMLIY